MRARKTLPGIKWSHLVTQNFAGHIYFFERFKTRQRKKLRQDKPPMQANQEKKTVQDNEGPKQHYICLVMKSRIPWCYLTKPKSSPITAMWIGWKLECLVALCPALLPLQVHLHLFTILTYHSPITNEFLVFSCMDSSYLKRRKREEQLASWWALFGVTFSVQLCWVSRG